MPQRGFTIFHLYISEEPSYTFAKNDIYKYGQSHNFKHNLYVFSFAVVFSVLGFVFFYHFFLVLITTGWKQVLIIYRIDIKNYIQLVHQHIIQSILVGSRTLIVTLKATVKMALHRYWQRCTICEFRNTNKRKHILKHNLINTSIQICVLSHMNISHFAKGHQDNLNINVSNTWNKYICTRKHKLFLPLLLIKL